MIYIYYDDDNDAEYIADFILIDDESTLIIAETFDNADGTNEIKLLEQEQDIPIDELLNRLKEENYGYFDEREEESESIEKEEEGESDPDDDDEEEE